MLKSYFFYGSISPKIKEGCLSYSFVRFCLMCFPSAVWSEVRGLSGRFLLSLLKHHSGTHFRSMCSSCHLPCLPQSGNAAPSLPIKLQSANEDGVRHRITSNIHSHTQACLCQPQISLQIKALKMGEVELPDNNQITSCRRLDVSFQLGSSFLPSLDVRRVKLSFSWLSLDRPFQSPFGRKLVIKTGWWSHWSLFPLDPCLIMKMWHRQPKHC